MGRLRLGKTRLHPRSVDGPAIRRGLLAAIAAVGSLTLASCGSSQSLLAPHSGAAERINTLSWVLYGVASFAFALVVIILLLGLFRRRPVAGPRRELISGTKVVVLGGIIFPICALTAVFVLTVTTIDTTINPPSPPKLTVHIIAQQWWWQVEYPNQHITTANEIHIPVGQPVKIVLTSKDVIHSFWVPQLQAKTDVVPGLTNTTWIEANKPGTYDGQCAEYCGTQHANMAFQVVAEPPAQFDQWATVEAGPALKPTAALAQKGAALFPDSPCAGCHTIRGTAAHGTFGPDLTHVGSRRTLAARTIPNTPDEMAKWISNAQKIKPGTTMPNMRQSPQDPFVKAVVAYLQSLR